MKYLSKSLFALAALLIVLVPSIPQVHAEELGFTRDNLLESFEIGNLTNIARNEQGLAPLRLDPQLYAIAYLKALEMAERGEFSHVLSDGVTLDKLLLSYNYNFASAGENIAFGFADAVTASDGLLASPVHAHNILSPDYADIGVAVVPMVWDGRAGNVVVEIFGRRL